MGSHTNGELGQAQCLRWGTSLPLNSLLLLVSFSTKSSNRMLCVQRLTVLVWTTKLSCFSFFLVMAKASLVCVFIQSKSPTVYYCPHPIKICSLGVKCPDSLEAKTVVGFHPVLCQWCPVVFFSFVVSEATSSSSISHFFCVLIKQISRTHDGREKQPLLLSIEMWKEGFFLKCSTFSVALMEFQYVHTHSLYSIR